MAAKTSVKASLPSLHDKPYSSLGLCVPQAILEETPVLHIHDRNNQRHILLQRYACKHGHLEREASGLHNSWNSCSILRKCIRNGLTKKIPWGDMPPDPPRGRATRIFMSSKCIRNGLTKKIPWGDMPPDPPRGRATRIFMSSTYCWNPLRISSYARGVIV